jgi:hypothetical protein
MKIEFDKTEFNNLIELIHIATWVIDAHVPDGKHPEAGDHYKVQQKIYGSAEAQGLGSLIDFDMKNGYAESRELEDKKHMKFLHDYDEHSFWQNLIEKLSARDLCAELGSEDAFFELDYEARLKGMAKFAEKYDAIFNKEGLKCLSVTPTQS